jgi:cation diffusion facilitator CzcD-associated flavoprotein CzcO
MQERLRSKPEIAAALVPQWPPGCKRLTPGPGYLEACCEKNVDYISTPIKRIGPNSIETVDGTVREIDALICATGFNV